MRQKKNPPPAANENRKQIYDDAHLKKIDEDRARWAKEDFYRAYRLEKEKELKKFYRLDEKKAEYAKTQTAWEKGQGFLARLTGKTSKLAEDKRVAKLNLENSQMRFKEQMAIFNHRFEKEKPEYLQKKITPEKTKEAAPKLRPDWEKAQKSPEPENKSYTVTKGMSASEIALEKARYRKQEIEKYKRKQQERGQDHGMER